MRLYHFLNEQYGLENIRNRRLKIARINELNDPFEFAGANLGNNDLREAFRKLKEVANKKRGLLCFSSKWSNPVMWSHYANNHKGLCLGFDVANEAVLPVSYSARRFALDLEKIKSPHEQPPEYIIKILFTKYAHWKYENEYRAFASLEDADKESELYFSRFSDRLTLKQVIVGAESSISREQLSEVLGEELQHVEKLKARLAFKSFRVVQQRNRGLWT